MGRGRKEFWQQSVSKQRCRELRKVNDYIMVSGLSGKPSYADIPNDIVDLMKKMDPRLVAGIVFKIENWKSMSVAMQIRGCSTEHEGEPREKLKSQ